STTTFMAAPIPGPVLVRPARPLRRACAVVLAAVGTADVAAAVAAPGNGVGIPVVVNQLRLPLIAYGVLLVLAGAWAAMTSLERPAASVAGAGGRPGGSRARRGSVVHALRSRGWYVADDVEIHRARADHVAVGPAGVLVVQVAGGADPQSRRSPAIRARIAAQQLRRVLAAREVDVEIVPAVLVPGPGREPAVEVVDSVAILSAGLADRWLSELTGRRLLPPATVDAVIRAVTTGGTGAAGARPPAARATAA
ncbi:MAG TPA: nuclease-related domain-containing protein, partial [Acidimicrobiales bacterium]|nr:nuclease-related domain-containing protein [Acidimicrobiales bacterium]